MLPFHTEMIQPYSFEEVCFLEESYENMQKKSNFENFESALYLTSGTLPVSTVTQEIPYQFKHHTVIAKNHIWAQYPS